jgi:hypothetical protein
MTADYSDPRNAKLLAQIQELRIQRQRAYEVHIKPYDELLGKLHGYLLPSFVLTREETEAYERLHGESQPGKVSAR